MNIHDRRCVLRYSIVSGWRAEARMTIKIELKSSNKFSFDYIDWTEFISAISEF